jgi:hypothetical protein
LSLNGWAVVVVILSKQRVNVTTGEAPMFIMIAFDVAGLFVVQGNPEVRTHVTISPFTGGNV